MPTKLVITIHFHRNDGRRERIRLTEYSLTQAREYADLVFRECAGLYTEADICREDGYVETVQNLLPMMANVSRI
jgi:hypothetical protein